MTEPTAIVLIAHGSPDPDWRRPIDAMAERLRERCSAEVLTAYLGFLEPDLSTAVADLAARGHTDVLVLSAFLSPGGKHIKRDIPELFATVAEANPGMNLQLRPGALGADPEVVEALAAAAARAARA
ncbi:MAG: CbiX/SirB N-terminal domain-containing protein [Myxococcota bacterium]